MSLEEEEFGSDTDDDDYVPDCDPIVASEEENSGDDEGVQDEASAEGGVAVKKKKRKNSQEAGKKKKKTAASGRGFMFEEASTGGEGSVDWKAEVEKEKAELNEEVEKKKTEDIWAEFKRDTGGGSKPKPKPSGGGLVSVLAPAPSVKNSLPVKPKSRFGSLFDDIEKSKEEAVGEGEKEVVKEKPKNRFGSLFDAPPKVEQAKENEESTLKSGDKVEITKVFDFAGEVVKVSKQVSADSKEAAKFLSGETSSSSTTKRSGGLAGVVGSITKKPKMGCLDKSKLDWNQFVQEKNIREELSTHNKGKDGYVEKLEFLERADLRQFEQEKALREKTRKSLMK